MTRVAFLGGNGHCAARLAQARRIAVGLELIDVPYPGFEGRPRASDLESFLDEVAAGLRAPALVYATGIGGLLALALRARRALDGTPVLMQAPVLWGLEHRLMPRLMRRWPAQRLVHRVFAWSAFQARFSRKHFQRPPSSELRAAFFDGYGRCAALPDMFAWLTPALLRRLEGQLVGRLGALDRITVWWGKKDRVVDAGELRWTSTALGVGWPLRVFPDWGHYPMLDEPEAWVGELLAFLSDQPKA
jgi:pimeloyl-ACP methyl ester carboxylesterase